MTRMMIAHTGQEGYDMSLYLVYDTADSIEVVDLIILSVAPPLVEVEYKRYRSLEHSAFMVGFEKLFHHLVSSSDWRVFNDSEGYIKDRDNVFVPLELMVGEEQAERAKELLE